MRNKITFIAQFPPPIHGLSKAVETLWQSDLQKKYDFEKIDISQNKRILKNLIVLIRSKSDLYYFTISQTRGGNWRDLMILKILEWKRKNVIVHLHGGYYRKLIDNDCGGFQRKLNYRTIRKLAGCIVLSQSLKSIFEGLVDESKIFVIPNCVDNVFMSDYKYIESKYDNLKSLNILYLSNFIETKGYKEVLLLALRAKNSNENHLQFHFAGSFFDKADEFFFNSFVADNKLLNVRYHGIVSGQAKIKLLQSSHLFILLTRYPNEGQPISILEAMANGMSIVTTNHAGIPDIITNGKNGLVVDKNNIDIDYVFSYFVDILKNNNLLKTIGGGNYQTAIECYTEKKYIENINRVFEKLCNQK